MSRLKKIEENRKKLTRFQTLKSIFSSMLITVTAVVLVVTVTPTSPKAEIASLEAFNNAIIYTVNVTDSDNAIIEDTLRITLENQFEEYEKYISVGSNVGNFQDLQEDTEYKLKVYADKGFGLEVLDSQTINTYPTAGGVLISKELVDQTEWNFTYQVEYMINDSLNEYRDIQVRYGFKPSGEDEVLHYQTMPISLTESSFILEGANSDIEVYLYLEAITYDDITIILDDLIFNTPFIMNGSIYTSRISHTSAEFDLWFEYTGNFEAEYEVLLKTHDHVVDRILVEKPTGSEGMHHEGISVEFTDLLIEQEYTAVLLAKYDDPVTLEYMEVEVKEVEFITLTDFEVNINISDHETYIEVTINLTDYEDTYDKAYYTIWEVSEFGAWSYEMMTYDFEFIDDEKYVTYIFSVPILEEMYIDIGIIDSTGPYNKIILEKIDNTEEVSE
jgi:hypothetical protein